MPRDVTADGSAPTSACRWRVGIQAATAHLILHVWADCRRYGRRVEPSFSVRLTPGNRPRWEAHDHRRTRLIREGRSLQDPDSLLTVGKGDPNANAHHRSHSGGVRGSVNEAMAVLMGPDARDGACVSAVFRHALDVGIDPGIVIALVYLETRNENGPLSPIRWNRDVNPAGIGIPSSGSTQPFPIVTDDEAA